MTQACAKKHSNNKSNEPELNSLQNNTRGWPLRFAGMSKPTLALSKQPSFPLTDLIPYTETKAEGILMFLFYSLLVLRVQGPCIHREALRKPGMLNSLGWRGNKI